MDNLKSLNGGSASGTEITRDNGRWRPGVSGNTAGRPIGARNRFADAFVGDVAATWEQHGTAILDKMAIEEPSRFAELCGRLVPKEMALTVSQRLPGNLDPDEWQLMTSVLRAVREAMPEANQLQPAEVLNFVLESIRSNAAPLIEGAPNMKIGGNAEKE